MPRANPVAIPPKPSAMTWRRATPVFILAIIFDVLRGFFAFFWLFGPALAFMYCDWKVGQYLWSGAASLVCSAGAGILGISAFAILAPFGAVMAMAVGFIGFLALFGTVFLSNRRIFHDEPISIIEILGGFALSEVPLLDAIPVFTFLIWRLYGKQIKKDAKKLQEWNKQYAAAMAVRDQEIAGQIMQLQQAQMQEVVAQEAENDAYAEEMAEQETGDNTYTQERAEAA